MLEMHPEYEDYYFNIEKIIIARVGMEIGGKMHTARSRNDLGSTMLRMNVRDTLMKIIPMVYELEKVVLMVLIAAAFTYMCVEMNTLVYRIGVNPNTMDLVVAVVVIVCVLEITRRTCVISCRSLHCFQLGTDALFLIYPGTSTDLIGLGLCAAAAVLIILRNKIVLKKKA